MKHSLSILRAVIPVLVLLSLPLSAVPENDQLDAHFVVQRFSHPRMDSALYRLMRSAISARTQGADIQAGMVNVTLHTRRETVTPNGTQIRDIMEQYAGLSSLVDKIGGVVHGGAGNRTEAMVPAAALETLLADPRITYIGRVNAPLPDITSEGVAASGAHDYHNRTPFKGTLPVKVAVIDVGFEGYAELLGSELPESVDTVSFAYGNALDLDKHGTGCAEIVHDMAPDASLVLMAVDSSDDLPAAVQYCIDNNVDVVTMSLSFYNHGPGNGVGPICNVFKRAYDNRITVVKSAGNTGNKHYYGTFSDNDGDQWHAFAPDDEVMEFHAYEGDPYSFFLSWNDWGQWNGNSYSGTDQDFDLYLLKWSGSEWEPADSSTDTQDGTQLPSEWISGTYPATGKYGIAFKRHNGTKTVELELYYRSYVENPEYNVSEGSITNGGESPYVLTVGAYNWDDQLVADYSSRGPTRNGLIKPDIAGPAGVSCSAYGTRGFSGTSAATPHVAGAVALIRSFVPFTQFGEVLDILNGRARDKGDPGPDPLYGSGLLYIGR